MSESSDAAQVVRPPLQLVRLPVDRPQPAVAFLRKGSRGVMELIAHFWERLEQTPPLQRPDLHLVAATPMESDNVNINIPQLNPEAFSGAMLYVPKAHRADVLALDPATAAAFAAYIGHQGAKELKPEPATAGKDDSAPAPNSAGGGGLPLTDLSAAPVRGAPESHTELPADMPSAKSPNGRTPIDFLTGQADGIFWMVPLLLPLVHRRTLARQLVNVVMELPPEVPASAEAHVRLARDGDVAVLNRWRRLYKEERGILFDADMDAWIQNQRVFVHEHEGQITALAKFDLELQDRIEIGGVFTFPEFRRRGFGAAIIRDLATRIRQRNKTPILQVDEQNTPALTMYERAGWRTLGKLARVWLTG